MAVSFKKMGKSEGVDSRLCRDPGPEAVVKHSVWLNNIQIGKK
jgi:hypothetical protein